MCAPAAAGGRRTEALPLSASAALPAIWWARWTGSTTPSALRWRIASLTALPSGKSGGRPPRRAKGGFFMRIAATVQDSIVDGPGLRFTVFVQGCSRGCPGCHNPDTHDPSGGVERTEAELIARMRSNPLTDGLSLSGGEPFDQPEGCL